MPSTSNNTIENNRPMRQHADDAGCDLSASHTVGVEPFGVRTAPTGYCPRPGDIPECSVGLVFARSSLHKRGLSLANGVGVIDSGYRGEVLLAVRNDSDLPVIIDKGERIAQIVVVPLDLSSALYARDAQEQPDDDQHSNNTRPRGQGGFGSTGRN